MIFVATGAAGTRCLLCMDEANVSVLSIHLLNEIAKGSTSQWYVYLVHLPRTHHTLSHFSSFEAEELQVSSRSLHVPWDKAGALCPIGDFFNYAPPGQSCNTVDLGGQNVFDTYQQSSVPLIKQQFDDENENGFGLCIRERLRDGGYDAKLGAYCFYARQDYEKGQQVLLSYGQYNNLELLEYYGFLLPDNPNNMVYLSPPDRIEFGHNNLDVNFQEQTSCNGFFITSNGSPSFSLLAAMRLSAASPALRKSHGYRALSGMQLSIEVDVAVYGWLSDKCQKLLENFPTTIQEDNILMGILSTCGDSSGNHIFSALLSEVCQGRKNLLDVLDRDVLTCPLIIHDNVIKQFVQMMVAAGFTKASSHSMKIGNLFDRCKAAIQWRLSHKAILEHCILYSNHKLLLLNKGL